MRSLDVELRAPPVAALGVVLCSWYSCEKGFQRGGVGAGRTWIFVSDFRRNHWGMGLPTYLNTLAPSALRKAASTHRFWRDALARMRFVRKVFWEGYRGKQHHISIPEQHRVL